MQAIDLHMMRIITRTLSIQLKSGTGIARMRPAKIAEAVQAVKTTGAWMRVPRLSLPNKQIEQQYKNSNEKLRNLAMSLSEGLAEA